MQSHYAINTIVLHRVVEGQAQNFIDIELHTLEHILSLSAGSLFSVDKALATNTNSNRSICLTFDDGFSSDYEIVLPELRKINASATFFIVTDWIGKDGYMTVDQIRALSEAGMQIGSHSVSHPNFVKLYPEQRVAELQDSKLILESIIQKKITSFSFPYGIHDSQCDKAVFSTGYSICCTSNHGLSSRNQSMISRNSINAKIKTNAVKIFSLINILILIGWGTSLIHYTPALELGGRQIFAYHTAISLVLLRIQK